MVVTAWAAYLTYLLLAQALHRPGWRWVRLVTPLGCLPILAYLAFSFARQPWVA